jgi:hypothetical protein
MFEKLHLVLITCGSLLLGACTAQAGDWESCNKALKELNSATNASSFLAYEAGRKEKQLEESKRLHVLMQTETDERVQEYKNLYQRHLEAMEKAFIRLQSAMFDAELVCYASVSSRISKAKRPSNYKLRKSMCLKMKKHTQAMPLAERLDFCKQIRFLGDCRRCLAP